MADAFCGSELLINMKNCDARQSSGKFQKAFPCPNRFCRNDKAGADLAIRRKRANRVPSEPNIASK